MLYTIQTQGSERIHYLFGTIHLGSEDVSRVSSQITGYIEKCNCFFGEMDITRVVPDFQKTFYIEDGKNLKNFYSERKFSKLSSSCEKYFEVDLMELLYLKPLFIVSKLGEILSNHSGKPMDAQLFEHALNKGLTVGGLETPERQMEIAALIPIDYQTKMLADTLRNVSSFKKKNQLLLRDYFDGKVNEVYKKTKKSLGKIRGLLLYERNELMAASIDQHLQSNPQMAHFFCFGAAHLGGQKGVLAHLKRSGYVVKPVTGFMG